MFSEEVNNMLVKIKEQRTKVWKKLFALPRGKLCKHEKPTKQISEKLQINDESVEGVHPRLV